MSFKQLDMNMTYSNRFDQFLRAPVIVFSLSLCLIDRSVLYLKRSKLSFESPAPIHFGSMLYRCLPFIWSPFLREPIEPGNDHLRDRSHRIEDWHNWSIASFIQVASLCWNVSLRSFRTLLSNVLGKFPSKFRHCFVIELSR